MAEKKKMMVKVKIAGLKGTSMTTGLFGARWMEKTYFKNFLEGKSATKKDLNKIRRALIKHSIEKIQQLQIHEKNSAVDALQGFYDSAFMAFLLMHRSLKEEGDILQRVPKEYKMKYLEPELKQVEKDLKRIRSWNLSTEAQARRGVAVALGLSEKFFTDNRFATYVKGWWTVKGGFKQQHKAEAAGDDVLKDLKKGNKKTLIKDLKALEKAEETEFRDLLKFFRISFKMIAALIRTIFADFELMKTSGGQHEIPQVMMHEELDDDKKMLGCVFMITHNINLMLNQLFALVGKDIKLARKKPSKAA